MPTDTSTRPTLSSIRPPVPPNAYSTIDPFHPSRTKTSIYAQRPRPPSIRSVGWLAHPGWLGWLGSGPDAASSPGSGTLRVGRPDHHTDGVPVASRYQTRRRVHRLEYPTSVQPPALVRGQPLREDVLHGGIDDAVGIVLDNRKVRTTPPTSSPVAHAERSQRTSEPSLRAPRRRSVLVRCTARSASSGACRLTISRILVSARGPRLS